MFFLYYAIPEVMISQNNTFELYIVVSETMGQFHKSFNAGVFLIAAKTQNICFGI